MRKFLMVFVLAALALYGVFASPAAPPMPAATYEPFISWAHLEWNFPDAATKALYKGRDGAEYWTGAMPAGFKADAAGNLYLSVPRWAPGIPATLNRVVFKGGEALLEPFPSWEMNKEGNPAALQSVLGYEIDDQQRMWILDQGHVDGAPSLDGSQKIVIWDLRADKLVDVVKIPDSIASYQASFLNDIVLDTKNGFAYIADSGIFSDPLQGGIVVYDMNRKLLRRVLHQHLSTQDLAGYWFSINGKKVNAASPMRTGADGIALSVDREMLYWCPLTSRNLYGISTAYLRDWSKGEREIREHVRDFGSKGTNTDGMSADNQGRIWFTMLEGMGIGYFEPWSGKMVPYISDPKMVWVDGLQFDGKGNIYFNNNRLHELFGGELNWKDKGNLVIWRARVGEELSSYLSAP